MTCQNDLVCLMCALWWQSGGDPRQLGGVSISNLFELKTHSSVHAATSLNEQGCYSNCLDTDFLFLFLMTKKKNQKMETEGTEPVSVITGKAATKVDLVSLRTWTMAW